MEFLVLTFSASYLLAGLLAIVIVLTARFVSVGVPVWLLRRSDRFDSSMIGILTWGGLRGGISVALALSLPGDTAGDPVPGGIDPGHDLRGRGVLDPGSRAYFWPADSPLGEPRHSSRGPLNGKEAEQP